MWSKVSVVFLLAAVAVVVNARPFGVAPAPLLRQAHKNLPRSCYPLKYRGGASSVVADEDEDVDLDESDEDVSDDEEENIILPKKAGTKLAASAVKAADKSKSKKTALAKSAVNSGLAETAKQSSPSKKKKSRKFMLPYILRACMNPFTVFAMTKAYFASLINLDYITKVRCFRVISMLSVFNNSYSQCPPCPFLQRRIKRKTSDLR